MSTPHRGRWFQFSLRTLLVTVTVFAILLGWQLSCICQRRGFVESMEEPVALENEQAGRLLVSPQAGTLTATSMNVIVSNASIPFRRRWLGDEAILLMWLPRTTVSRIYSPHIGFSLRPKFTGRMSR